MATGKRAKNKLTPLRKFDLEVEGFVSKYALREGLSPSEREIGEGLGKAKSTVHDAVKRLIAHGRLEPELANGRGLTPQAIELRTSTVPLLGFVAAGKPIEAIEGTETVEVPPWMMKPSQRYFVLRVRGQSMIDDQIENDDLVLIRESKTASNGERVVALINNEATLKRFERRGQRVFLHPANASMASFEIGAHEELRIAGILAGVLRKADG